MIGNTNLNLQNEVISCISVTPSIHNVFETLETGIYPPMKFIQNLQDKNDEDLLNRILHRFMNIYKLYDLDDVLWKLNTGKTKPLGIDLPILHSGLEVFAKNHLSIRNILKKYSKTEKKDYKERIKPILESINALLENYQFSDSVINKISNPFETGSGEKLRLFFNSIGFNFPSKSIENKALQARNKMAHSSISNIDKKTAKEFIKYKNVYINIYHRIILKIMGVKGKYLDYYSSDLPEREIDSNIPR